jgi:hypothetical protein
MNDREQALAEIKRLAADHEITSSEIAAALTHPALTTPAATLSPTAKGSLLMRILSYLGGIFIFAGLAVFIGMQWDDLNSAARVVVTLGSGLALFAMAYIAQFDPRVEKAVIPLFVISAALQPFGIAVALNEFSSVSNWLYGNLAIASVMLFQQGLVFWKTKRTALLFTTLVFGTTTAGIGLDLLDADEDLIFLILGVSVILLSISIDKTAHKVITPFWYFCGSAMFFWGLFEILEHSVFEILYLGATCGMVYLSTFVRSRTLLVTSTLALLSFIGYFTAKNFVDSIGWPIALIMLGFLMIGLSAAAFRISRKYIGEDPNR